MTIYTFHSKKIGDIKISCTDNLVTMQTQNLEIKSINQYTFDELVNYYGKLFTNPANVTLFQSGNVWSLSDIKNFIANELNNCEHSQYVNFLVSDRSTQTIIGSLKVGLEEHQYALVGSGHTNVVEIGYLLDKACWGKGYGTELTIAGKKYIKLINHYHGINDHKVAPKEIVATVHPDNVASLKILKKCLKNKEDEIIYKFDGNPRLFFYKPIQSSANDFLVEYSAKL